jgi:catechol 2,3-dioxygenase-like lactoylglutathione lyase family enzyme
MFDHVTVRVADRAVSETFFSTVLAPLGIDKTLDAGALAGWREFMLSEGDPRRVTTGLHVGFAAPSRRHVDDFWQAGVDAGYRSQGVPGPRPQYREDYYGAFLRDPSGNSIEAVHHGALPRDGAIIDHVWIRVLDLPAATAFYRIVAAAADLDVRYAGGDRATLAAVDAGGSFTLVSGSPTANLHMAFPGSDEAVRRFHDGALAAGFRDNGAPGERPRYHPGYYAAFALDPDGNNIELVNHHAS